MGPGQQEYTVTVDINSLYFSEPAARLELGLDLHRNYGDGLNGNGQFATELEKLDCLISRLQDQMSTMDMFDHCKSCGQKEGGGCCSAYMAGETDSILILINLLLGVDVGIQRTDDMECVYLGQRGCIFKAKPMFCLNYNCSSIYKSNPREVIACLDKAAGNVLRQQYKVEQNLLRLLDIR